MHPEEGTPYFSMRDVQGIFGDLRVEIGKIVDRVVQEHQTLRLELKSELQVIASRIDGMDGRLRTVEQSSASMQRDTPHLADIDLRVRRLEGSVATLAASIRVSALIISTAISLAIGLAALAVSLWGK